MSPFFRRYNINKQKYEIIKQLHQYAQEYHYKLENKEIIFIYCQNQKTISYIETVFYPYNFLHLTGLKIINSKILNSKDFYQKLLKNRIKPQDFEFKNNVSKWKLEAMPQIMKIDVLANQIGDFMRIGNLLKTDILIGTTRNVCLGLKFLENKKIYVPNTVLKEDIRKITSNRYRIIVILKKNIKEKKYENITYIHKNINLLDIFNKEEILDKIDIKNLYYKNKKFYLNSDLTN